MMDIMMMVKLENVNSVINFVWLVKERTNVRNAMQLLIIIFLITPAILELAQMVITVIIYLKNFV
jgi:hypothetical protein